MSKELYHHIYSDDDIFQRSDCIWHENSTLDFIRSALICQGYARTEDSGRIWIKGDHTVIVCLVDDFTSLITDWSIHLPYQFDERTIILTDTFLMVPSQYQTNVLPSSFFGIYSYDTEHPIWQPERDLGFAINRLDVKRLQTLLRLAAYGGGMDQNYVNFNCWYWQGRNEDDDGRKENFEAVYKKLPTKEQEHFQGYFPSLRQSMPYRNYDCSHAEMHSKVWLNLVVETYSSDLTIAFSEKIFRSLSSPYPWICFAGRFAVTRLKQLGFDVADDVIDHAVYDGMCESEYDKASSMISTAVDLVKHIKSLDQQQVRERYRQAADQNKQLLKQFRQQWPHDFAVWWTQVLRDLPR